MIHNGRTYIIQLHRISSRVTTIIHRCNYISCWNLLICRSWSLSLVELTIYKIQLVTIFISVNNWSLSIFNYRLVIDSNVILVTFSCIISCRCRSVFINYFDGVIRRLNSCNFVFQLFYVNCICIVFTGFNVSNFITTII